MAGKRGDGGGEGEADGSDGGKVVATTNETRARARPRGPYAKQLTPESVARFCDELLSDVNHNVETAAIAVEVSPGAVRQGIYRYTHGKCSDESDEALCEALYAARAMHVRELRKTGSVSAELGNRAGTAWAQWRCEQLDPLNHPRKGVEVEVEASAKSGDGESEARVRYVVSVPEPEPED